MTEYEKSRVKAIASALVAGMIDAGEIECSEEAIRAAMPKAIADARAVLNAATEYLCG